VVDFAKLANGVDDDMPGQPQGVPQHGAMNRILASRLQHDRALTSPTSAAKRRLVKANYSDSSSLTRFMSREVATGVGLRLDVASACIDTNYNQYLGSRSSIGTRRAGQRTHYYYAADADPTAGTSITRRRTLSKCGPTLREIIRSTRT